MASSSNSQTTAAQEKKARDFLAQGRFRKARDEFKALCKIDRAGYLPELIQANVGLAKEMLAKGQTSEAEQVIAYLRTIASQEQLRSLDTALALRAPCVEENLEVFIQQLLQKDMSVSDADKIQLADRLVVAFKEAIFDDPATAALMAEIRAVQEALKAVSLERWSEAAEALHPISHGSCFSHWKMYVKGISAFYQGQIEKAVAALSRLPADSIPGRASQALLVYADKSGAGSPPGKTISEEETVALCRLMGHPELGRPLAQAEAWWRQHNILKSYLALRDAIPDFPSDDDNELGGLSDFFFNNSMHQQRQENRTWERFLFEIIDRKSTKSMVERRRALRSVSLTNMDLPEVPRIKKDLDAFLELHQKLHGANPRLESQACLWLANTITGNITALENRPAFQQKPPFVDLVVELLNRSCACDRENLPAWLKLCQVYEMLGHTSDRNRLLDEMTRQFPDETAVLLQAGRGCMDRKALQKGIQYLERAYELDRIDPSIKDALVDGRQKLARQLYRDGKTEKARAILAQNEPLLGEDSTHPVRSRWAHRIVQGACELISGDPARSDSCFEEARRLSPSTEAFLFHADMVCRTWDAPQKRALLTARSRTFLDALKGTIDGARVANAALLLALRDFWLDRFDLCLRAEDKWFEKYLQAAHKNPFTRKEVLDLVERHGAESPFGDCLEKLLRKQLKRDPLDPAVRLALYGIFPPLDCDAKTVGVLNDIAREASKRQDYKSRQQAEKLLEQLKKAPPPSAFDTSWMDDDQDPVDTLDNFSFADALLDEVSAMMKGIDLNQMKDFIKGLPAAARKDVEQVTASLGTASEEELEAMRKSPPFGMPPLLLEMFITIAGRSPTGKNSVPAASSSSKARANPPIPRPNAKPAPVHNRDLDDPNQLPLF